MVQDKVPEESLSFLGRAVLHTPIKKCFANTFLIVVLMNRWANMLLNFLKQ